MRKSRRYDPGAGQEVERAMHDFKHEHRFKSRQQAIAVGLHKARKKGKKVPPEH
jgi:hypothetical protein